MSSRAQGSGAAASTFTQLPLPTEVERLVRVPMAFEDYLVLPEWHRAEYVDGLAIVSPSPAAAHQRIARRLANLIEASCPSLFVVDAVGVWTGERRSRIPDVVVAAAPFVGPWADEPPVLVVEVASPSTRREDLIRKAAEYLEVGIEHYWLVDGHHSTFTALRASANAGAWDVMTELDAAGTTSGSIELGNHGRVEIDLAGLLAT